MSRKEYGVGIVGAGFMGRTHTYNYLTMPLFYDDRPFKTRLVGICDADLSKARELQEAFGFEFATDKYEDLLARKDVHLLDICTPTLYHCEQIVGALEAKKHVYVDKPLCATVDEAKRVLAVAEKAGAIGQVAYHYRFYPAMMKAKRLLADGFLGRPVSFRMTFYHSSNLDPNKPMGWKQDKAMGGGGVLIEMACHVLDLIFHFFGEYETARMESLILYPERPRADGARVKVEAEDHVLLTIRMKNGALGTAEVSKVVAGTNDDFNFELYGARGAIRYEMMNPNFLRVYDARDNARDLDGNSGFKAVETVNKFPGSKANFPGPRFPIGWIRGHVASQRNFVRCVHEGEAASPSLADAAYIQEITQRIYDDERKRAHERTG